MVPEKPGSNIRVWFTHSDSYYALATSAWAQSIHVPDQSVGAQRPLTALVLSHMSLEAFANELVVSATMAANRCPKAARLRDFTRESVVGGRIRTGLKLNLAMMACTGEPFDTGAQPFQHFALLTDIRNALVHYVPGIAVMRLCDDGYILEHCSETRKFIDRVRGAGILKSEAAAEKAVPILVLASPRTEAWACQTAFDMVQELIRVIPAGPWLTYMTGTMNEFRRLKQAVQ